MNRARIAAMFVAIALLCVLPTAAGQAQLAKQRAQHLRHGINLSEWFAQKTEYPTQFLQTYTTVDDVHLVKRLGFDHVRISIDPEPLSHCILNRTTGPCSFVDELDKIVNAAVADDLAVMVDIHPNEPYKKAVITSDAAVDSFFQLWRVLAARYAKLNPDLIFFEVMNEPEFTDAYRWNGVQEKAASVIRSVAPKNTIIVAGANYSSLRDLLNVQPLTDENVIYNFHYYDPHIFTHQGASWSFYEWKPIRNLPYPSDPESARRVAATIPEGTGRLGVLDYGLSHWNFDHINGQMRLLADWAAAHHLTLICNEFGAYRAYSDPESRARWIDDTRRALEQNGIGWTMWDYRGGFGVVHKQDGQPAVPDPSVVRALGLRAAQ